MNLAALAEAHPPGAPALVGAAGSTTWGELRASAGALRARLGQDGVGRDDRVAIVAGNAAPFVVAYLAVLGAGAVAVPLNPASPVEELRQQLATADVAAVLTDGEGGHAGEAARLAAGDLGRPEPPAVTGITAGADAGTAVRTPADRTPADVAVLMPTPGTLGTPRLAMLTHGNLLANLEQRRRLPGVASGPTDVFLGVLPLCHIFGLNVVLGEALLSGAAVLLVERFDPATTLELIERHHVTVLLGVPTMFAALAALPGAGPLAGVRLASSGAAALDPEVAHAFRSRFGVELVQGYGLTEAAPVVTAPAPDGPGGPASVGVPLPGVDVRLVDEEGEAALVGDPGEVWVRGANVFHGYWRDEDATRQALTPEGWLRTGDVAVAGDGGELYIVGRTKDVVNVSGFNVSPAEVEDVLRRHPGVADAAVVGVADPRTGQAVVAFLVATDPAVPPPDDAVVGFARQRLAGYKVPVRLTWLASLPYGAAGKLLRRRLPLGG